MTGKQQQIIAQWKALGAWHSGPKVKRCNAYARSTGKQCRAQALANGKCKNHGGLSTGPKTPEGKSRIAEAQRRRWARYRAQSRS